jgi:hypothetical protein
MILIMTSNNGFIFSMFNFALEFVETSKTIKAILNTLENKNNITMKSFFLSLILLLSLSFAVKAQNWAGAISSNWNDPNNWIPAVVPISTSNVNITNTGNSPKLQSNVTIGVINVHPGVVLDFNGYSMTVLSNIGGYVTFNGATLINTNGASDIVLNITTGTSGYYATFDACTVNDKITFNIAGSDVYYEGSTANQYNGDVVYNVNSGLTTYLSYSAASQYAANLSFNRNVAGSSYILAASGSINGNFNYQNLAGGLNSIGNGGITTNIGGTCTINASYPSPNAFVLRRIKNQTTGGSINVQNSTGFDVQDDTLKVNSLTIQGYRANAYASFLHNQLNGNLTLADDASYTGGYYTEIHQNHITGNTSITINGTNTLYEANGANNANTFIGNTVFNLNSGASAYISNQDKSNYNGNLTILRTVAGYTRAFNAGANITGNFVYNNNSSGANELGNLANLTLINGTINMNVNLSPVNTIIMSRIINQTPGGKINLYNTQGFNLQNDSLLVDSLNIKYYRGSAYGVLFNNQINGHLTLADSTNYGGGYYTDIRNNTINGHTSFTVFGTNTFYEADAGASSNTYNGNVLFNLKSSASAYISNLDTSQFNGNLSIIRTIPGYTRAFNSGANITGNFTYTNNASGDSDFGSLNTPTHIAGTVNIHANLSPIGGMGIYRIINQTSGGKINVYNSRGFNIQSDSLKLDSLNIVSYRGNAFGYLYNNQIEGHLQLADSTSYGGGYNTTLQNNTITGNTMFRIYGTNTFYEANGANSQNTFNGNVTMNIAGSAEVYTNYDTKSTINGNFTVNRTGNGYSFLFRTGANITGNFSFTKNASGSTNLGNINHKTSIGGTVNINATQTTNHYFTLHRIHNATNGGSINLQSILGMDIQKDTLQVTSLNVTGYGGGAYAYIYNNLITGNVNTQDNVGYTNGYGTFIQNNTINGNSVFTTLGTNILVEANTGNLPNTFNGNVTFNGNGSGGLYISNEAASTFNGNLNINRSVAGVTNAFNFGGYLNGNLSYLKNVGGASEFGHINRKTNITGTITMSVTQTKSDIFNLFWLQNGTTGGSINIQNTRSFNFQKDSLKLTTLNVIDYGENAYAYFLNNQLEGNLNLSDDAAFGNGYSTILENNTINGQSSFTINGNNQFYDGNGAGTGSTYLGNTTYTRNGAMINIGNGDTNSYAGNLIFNSSLSINANQIQLIGNANTTINQLGTANIGIQKLILNKTGIGNVSLEKPVQILNSCHFISGDILSTLSTPLIFLDNTTQNNANDNSHIVGSAIKIGDDAFSFPVGNGVGLNTIAISAPSNVSDSIQANILVKHPDTDGYSVASKDPALINLAPFHYWTLNRISGTNPLAVTLGWGNPCVNAGITDLPSLAVARWNGASWANLGNSATTGSPASGTVTMSGTTTNFGPFILASTTNLNQWSGSFTAVTGTNSPICAGSSTVLTATGAVSYTWMPGNLVGNPVTVNPMVTTTYTVTGASATGCLTSATKTINVIVLPSLTTTVTNAAICTGASTTITVSGANTYAWQPGALTGTSNTVSPAVTTVYTITGTHANGCTNTTTRMITVGSCAACDIDVTISTSPYSILLTESQTYIKTEGTVMIDSGSYVKFDAAPTSYVLLNPGFLAKNGSVFIAQAFNGCTAGSPQLPQNKSDVSESIMEEKENIFVYPNPTTGKITIEYPATLKEANLFDLMGKKVMHIDLSGSDTKYDMDIGHLPNGVYIFYAEGFTNIKIIKN